MLTLNPFKKMAIPSLLATLVTTFSQLSIGSEVLHYWRFEEEPGFLEDSVGTATLTTQEFDQVALPAEGRGDQFPNRLPGIGDNQRAAETPPTVAGFTTHDSTPIDDAFTIELFANVDDLDLGGNRSVLVAQNTNPFRSDQFSWAFAIERSGPVGDWPAVPRELELFASDGEDTSQFASGILIDEQTDYFLSASFDIEGDIRFYVKNLSDGSIQTANVEHSMSELRPDSTLQIGVPKNFAVLDGIIDEVRLSRGVVPIEALLVNLARGDVNADGQVNAQDIDLIASSLRTPNPDGRFDIDGDGLLTAADHTHWVKDKGVMGTWFGDANLDGEFNSGDLVQVFQAGAYEADGEAGWGQGDWTGDHRFDSADFVAAFQDGGFEVGGRSAVSSVPEPSCAILLGIGIVGLGWVRRRQ